MRDIKTKEISYLLFLGLIAFFYTLVRFNGLESHTGYYGLAYKIIHPDSFQNDIYSIFHPAMISIYSLLVKLAGDLWLDDRFNLIVCTLLVWIAFLAVDRIAVLLGLRNRFSRLAVIALIMMDHFVVDNVALVADALVYRPSTFAGPIGLWLAYFVLKGSRPWTVLGCAALLVGFSFKNGWFPGLSALLLLLNERYRFSWKTIILFLGFGTTLFFIGHYYYHVWQGTLEKAVYVFDQTIQFTENSEANPFQDGLGPLLFLALLGTLFWAPFDSEAINKRMRTLAKISMVTYLLGGFYYTFSPDGMKSPFLAALAVSRSTWWIQLLCMIGLSVFLLLRLERTENLKRKIIYNFLLALLYFFPFVEWGALRFFFDGRYPFVSWGTWLTAATLFVLSMVTLVIYKRNRRFLFLKFVPFLCWPILATTAFYYGYRIYKRVPHLKFLVQHGIMGGTGGAQYVGLNEFFREKVEPGLLVVVLSGKGNYMGADTGLKIRAGVSMPFGHEINFYFDADKRKESLFRQKLGGNLAKRWRHCQLDQVQNILSRLGSPNYFVVPTDSLCPLEKFPYRSDQEINGFSILARKSSSVAPAGPQEGLE